MYEKFGLSLGQTNKYDINIIGFHIKNLSQPINITFQPVFNFNRLGLQRLAAPWKCFKKYIKLKPELIIINTHELLIVTLLYKIIFGVKIIYDVQENYYRNLLYTDSFPKLLRPLLAGYVRLKEYISRPFIDHYFLAEKNYENEFSFSKRKSTIIENKYKPLLPENPPQLSPSSSHEIRLIFTGTIAESTGVFEAIKIAIELHKKKPEIRLKIVGYCAKASTYRRLLKAIENRPFIELNGGRHLVSYKEILTAIAGADFGIIYYPTNRSTMNTMPTKLFEYIGNGLPILIQDHQPWVEFCNHYKAAVTIDVEQLNTDKIIHEMKSKMTLKIMPNEEVFWQLEEEKLLKIIGYLL